MCISIATMHLKHVGCIGHFGFGKATIINDQHNNDIDNAPLAKYLNRVFLFGLCSLGWIIFELD